MIQELRPSVVPAASPHHEGHGDSPEESQMNYSPLLESRQVWRILRWILKDQEPLRGIKGWLSRQG